MLKIRKIPFIAHRKKSVAQAAPPVIGPVMIDADFDSGKLIMEFDRDVSLDHFVPSAITVNDPDSGSKYVGSGGDVAAGSIVQVFMDIGGSIQRIAEMDERDGSKWNRRGG